MLIVNAAIDPNLLAVPEGARDVTAVTPIDGLSYVEAGDPAMPSYRVIAGNRSPAALRDLMILPVRTGYIGRDRVAPDPAASPPSGEEAVPGVTVAVVYIPIRDGVARARVYRPEAAGAGDELPVILYIHGGGFTVGSSEDTDYITRRLARDNHALVVSTDYRLAPEWPFPTPLDDVIDVYGWLTQSAPRVGGRATGIVVVGDSAGSNFAAALPIAARDRALPSPRGVVMLGAFVDFAQEQYESFQRLAPRGIVYDSAFFGFIRSAYLPTTPWDHPLASPLHADLTGYPPAFVTAGTHDPIVDSAKAFVAALLAAGGTAEGYWPDGMPHGYYFFPGVQKPEGDRAFEMVAAFLADHP
jgi:acetyl esterase